MNRNCLTHRMFIRFDIDEDYLDQYLPPQLHNLYSKYVEILGVFTTYSQALRFIEENGGENPIEYPEFGDTYDRSGAHLTISTITDDICLDLKNGEQIYIHIVIRGGSWNHDMFRDIGVCGATEVSEEERNDKDVYKVYLPFNDICFELWLHWSDPETDAGEGRVLRKSRQQMVWTVMHVAHRLETTSTSTVFSDVPSEMWKLIMTFVKHVHV